MSNNLKRKRVELINSDEDDDDMPMARQILPVANLPEDFNGEPLDGLQYLFTVRRDAKLLPHITRVPNPYEAVCQPPSTLTTKNSEQSHIPSEEWRAVFERRFKNFRQNISQPTIHVQAPLNQSSSRKLMPDKRERDCWWAFLAGKPESVWNPPKKPSRRHPAPRSFPTASSQGYHFDSSTRPEEKDLKDYPEYMPSAETQPSTGEAEVWRVNEDGELEQVLSVVPPEPSSIDSGAMVSGYEYESHPYATKSPHATSDPTASSEQYSGTADSFLEPTPVLLQNIDHKTALHLLMYFAHWINLHLEHHDDPTTASMSTTNNGAPSPPYYPITQSHGMWMFSLLSRVEDFVSSDDMSLLRNLARGCIGLIRQSRARKAVQTIQTTTTTTTPPAPGPPPQEDKGLPRGNHEADLKRSTDLIGNHDISEASCWLIVAAVVGVWGQRDLWMDAEQELSRQVS